MAKSTAELIMCVIFISSTTILFLLNKSVVTSEAFRGIGPDYNWIVHSVANVVGYSTVFIPSYLVYKYIRKINYLEKGASGIFPNVVRYCFGDDDLIDRINSVPNVVLQRTELQKAGLLIFYFCGLQISFLSWGVLQEKVMTQKYVNSVNEEGYFKDSQFLVFVNRILAFCMSGIIIYCTRQQRHKCPMYKYTFCSVSNILSSWCQYEALKYVSFLNQVLAKAAKTIPVMVMGKIVSQTKYEYYEYITAIILSIGMLFFMVDTGDNHNNSTITTFSGIILLCAYIAFDSFTSNWQGALFKQYGMSPVQMMCIVNLFSCILTSTSLLQQGGFINSINFMVKFPTFVIDCVCLSICSAVGQLLIFSTLSTFGPLVFAIISTIRQGFSVLLSCIIYDHKVNALGIFGIILVFCSIFLRIYCGHRLKVIRDRMQGSINKI